MKRSAAILLLALLPAAFGNGPPLRIMPLGDSITRGFPTSPENGYRKTLFNLLQHAGYTVDFVGSAAHGDFTENQHEGHNGWYADHTTETNTILSHVAGWMASTPADIVLLHIGTNDILDSPPNASATEVSNIVDEIFTANSNATVVLALIINGRSDQSLARRSGISTYNSNLNTMAQNRISNGNDLIVVDMENGADLDYSITSTDIGTFHPSQLGYDKMATNWLSGTKQAITNQIIKSLGSPTIDSLMVSGGIAELDIGNLITGKQVFIQLTEELNPPAWSNAGSFVSQAAQTNWTVPVVEQKTFYRITIQ